MKEKIKIGDKIIINKGIMGIDYGELISVEGWSLGGYFGVYESSRDGKKHIFDETVHRLCHQDI